MATSTRVSVFIAAISLALALTAFVLGSAPFTPALSLAFLAMPIGALGLHLGAARTSCLAFFWSFAALLTTPLANVLGIRFDVILVIFAAFGVLLAVTLFFHYHRNEK